MKTLAAHTLKASPALKVAVLTILACVMIDEASAATSLVGLLG